MHGSTIGEYLEPCGAGSSYVIYPTSNFQMTHTVHKVNVPTPTFMRAPGEAPGTFALECAMDELSEALKMDPLQLRLNNYADTHPRRGSLGQLIIFERHTSWGGEIRLESENADAPQHEIGRGKTHGLGHGTATYPARKFPGTARIRIMADPDGGFAPSEPQRLRILAPERIRSACR